MVKLLFGQGKGLSDSANAGAGSVSAKPTGEKFGSEYATGVGNKSKDANSKAKTLSSNAKLGASSQSGYEPGSNFGKGFVDGIGAWLKSAADAAANLAISAYNSLKKALDEHSPSRKTKKSGKNFDLGLAYGVEDNADYAISAVEQLGEDTLEALDLDALYEKMKGIDTSEMMNRINLAVEDKQASVSDTVVAGVAAKERERSISNSYVQKAPEINYKQLGREMSKRPVVVVVNADKRKIATLMAKPIGEEQEADERLARMMKGEWL